MQVRPVAMRQPRRYGNAGAWRIPPPVSLMICAAFWCVAASKMVPARTEGVAGKLNPAAPLLPGVAFYVEIVFAFQTKGAKSPLSLVVFYSPSNPLRIHNWLFQP